MPSPIGHALAGLAAGWAVRGASLQPLLSSPARREALLFAGLGIAPDLDLFLGIHSGPTHGLGMALLAGLAAWLPVAGAARGPRLRLALACVLAYASHTLLDWLGTDSSPPLGIMALWPFTREYYESSLHLFPAVSRRFHQPELFWGQNLRALFTELIVLGPIVVISSILTRRAGAQESLGKERRRAGES